MRALQVTPSYIGVSRQSIRFGDCCCVPTAAVVTAAAPAATVAAPGLFAGLVTAAPFVALGAGAALVTYGLYKGTVKLIKVFSMWFKRY
jgi:hypothetical protein